ncbi:glucose-6-phosphate dehydrogenase assembly protein OpcA [Gordonia alkaliphila]|uniref:glucose-6-phosphate dehydrogenase assembly protein OpcA n=1 Tax=Gordonia alkaliphila TaxID=1053547 RepID=UPI001FF6614E|nr:glucose-6-phosphate dehydrogenase assembly protein OpcA [Gordonia alkaliphila]MCK0440598.1 glucose-6-phosphate dehydrogenase assembly protein OpcA [Gordonia alkaliphila]
MIVDLPDTTTLDISKKLVRMRNSGGEVTIGRVLTLVIDTDAGEEAEAAVDASNQASREHPCRVIVVSRGDRNQATQLDAQIRVGGDAGASEVVVLDLHGELADHPHAVVTPFLLPDTPVVTWWPGRAPARPAADPLGRLASRRITDARSAADCGGALAARRLGYSAGDTDLAWSATTPWRAMLASALDRPPHAPVDSASVCGPAHIPGLDLIAGWLAHALGVPVTRRVGDWRVSLERSDGAVELVMDDAGGGSLHFPGRPDGRMPFKRRTTAECLAEELRRLDADIVYRHALEGLSSVTQED